MNPGHDHAAMLANATTSTNHADHMMDHGIHAGAAVSGQNMHPKDMMMMAMTFHGGYTESILFDQWSTKTVGAFVASWFAVFFLAVLYEALKTFRDYLSRRNIGQQASQTQTRDGTLLPADDQGSEGAPDRDTATVTRTGVLPKRRARLLSLPHIIQTLLHILQMTISYLLMLVAMTYNTYLFFGVVLGAGLGHFLFAWCRSSVIDYNEHCH